MGRRKITKRITACMLAILLACSSIPMESFRVMAATEDIPNIPVGAEVLLGFGVFGENNEFTWEFYGGTNRLHITGEGDMPDFPYCAPEPIIPPDFDSNDVFLSDADDDLLPDMEIGAYPDEEPVNGNELADAHSTSERAYMDVRPWTSVSAEVKIIDISEEITHIGNAAFQDFKKLETVHMPVSVQSIGAGAFCDCESLKSLTFGGELETIEEEAFRLSGLTEIHFQGNAPQMGTDVFGDVTATVYHTAEDESWQNLVGNNYGGTLDWQPTELIESGTFGDGFTWAFYKGMDRLYINGTGDMPDFAFCDPDTDFEIPDADKQNTNESAHSDDRPWASVSGQVKEIFLSKAITSIGAAAFQDFKQLELVYIPSVTSVEAGAFCCCESLKSLTFGGAFQKIGDKAFSRSGLSEIHFQGSAPQISEDPFYHVTATVYYPASNASWQSLIGENFGGALSWQSVADRKECLAGGRFGEDLGLTWTFYDSGRLVISGTGKIPDYQYCPPSSDMPPIPPDDDVPVPPISGGDDDPYNPNRPVCDAQETGSEVENNTFKENLNYSRPWEKYNLRIKTLEVAEGITKIGKNSFVDAVLIKVSLPESLADISDYAFANCKSLTNITIPSGVCNIGHWAFGLAGLKTIYFAGNAPDISEEAFHEVTADVYYPQNSAGWEEIIGQDFGGKLTWHNTDQKKDLSSCSAELSQSEYTYDGTEKKPDVTVKDKNKELRKGTDYTIEYSDNIEVGTATVTITGIGNYQGTISKTFTIVQANVEGTNVSWLDASLEYMECVCDGTAKEPSVTLKDKDKELKAGTDYTIEYSDNIDPGTANVKICGIGAYTGTGNLKFKITKRKPSLKFSKNSLVKTYGDQAFINQLTQETDGAITYESSDPDVASVDENGKVNIKNAGSTVITVTAAEGKYYQSASESYSLEVHKKKAALSFKAKSLTKAYGTSAFTNKLSKVTDGKINFKSSNSQVATVNKTGKVTIKGIGKTKITVSAAEGENYSANSASYTLKVNPKGTNILKITPAKKGFTVKWKEQRKQTTGYQVQYATNSKFSRATNVTLKNTTVSKKISKLKAKKKYFVRVRTYKTVSGKKYVSSWSKTKSVTTRK